MFSRLSMNSEPVTRLQENTVRAVKLVSLAASAQIFTSKVIGSPDRNPFAIPAQEGNFFQVAYIALMGLNGTHANFQSHCWAFPSDDRLPSNLLKGFPSRASYSRWWVIR